MPFRWHRSCGASSVMNGGRQRGTKLWRASRVARQEKSVLTIHSSGRESSAPPHATSWHWIPPVPTEDRGSQQGSWRPGGAIDAASSGYSTSDQIWPLPATASSSAPTATPMARSKPRNARFSSPSATPTATSCPAWYVETSSEHPASARIRGSSALWWNRTSVADSSAGKAHRNLRVKWRTTLLPAPPQGVKVNCAFTFKIPSRLRILFPARVGLSVIVLLPDDATTFTDFFRSDPATGRATRLPPPAVANFTVRVPLAVSRRPSVATRKAPPALMSLTRTVPVSVPSDIHGSWPRIPSSAARNNEPATAVSEPGSS